MLQRRGFSIAITTVAVLLVSACQPGPPNEPTIDDAPTPSPTVTPTAAPTTSVPPSATPSPSPSPTAWESFPPPDADEIADVAAIRKAWETYQSTLDKYAKDPSLKNFDEMTLLTGGEELSNVVHSIGRMRDDGLYWSGHLRFSSVKIAEPTTRNDGVRVGTVTACKDFTAIEVLDQRTGKPATGYPEGYFASKLTVTSFLEQAPNGKWLVTGGSAEEGC
ncbi:MAG: hypothetical protein E7L00_02150 [Propionibacteriaceae bacterium]|nr:hypothetical protein [Propionibacteriaceae bacterium]